MTPVPGVPAAAGLVRTAGLVPALGLDAMAR